MRLIDADELRKRIKAKNASNAMMRAMKAECLAEIDDAPTIEVRKEGVWKINIISMLGKCSECGFESTSYWGYCPGCGARMEGVESDKH